MKQKTITLLIALSILLSLLVISVFGKEPEEIKPEITTTVTSTTVVTTTIATTTIPTTTKIKTIDEIVKEVVAGKWGNGDRRKEALIKAGYDYNKIQKEIDKKYPKTTVTTTNATMKKQKSVKLPSGKYPEAQLIWDIMEGWGWSPETRAGIIGNMMAEVGGGTLDLSNWDSNGGCGYGLIQWTSGRRDTIKRRYGSCPTIAEQLEYMKDELYGTHNTTQQVSDSTLSIIMNKNSQQSPEVIAYAFASYYERCASQYREQRKGYARIAYEYFMNK